MKAEDWNPSDVRRWDPKYGPLPIYGRAKTDRTPGGSAVGEGRRRRSKRAQLKNQYRRYAKYAGAYIPFKAWLQERSHEAQG